MSFLVLLDFGLELDLDLMLGLKRGFCLELRLELDLDWMVRLKRRFCLDLRLQLDLDRVVGLQRALRLGRGFSVLLLLQENLVVEKLELCGVQFWFGEKWWWLFVEGTGVFL